MTKLVLETLTTEHKGVKNRLSVALESLIERIVSKVVRVPQTITEVTELSSISLY